MALLVSELSFHLVGASMNFPRILEAGAHPKFKLDLLPPDEREEAGLVNLNLNSLHRWATNYWTAKSLFENCTNQRVLDPHNGEIYAQWQLCAARDCVMGVYHFGRTIEGIDISMGRCSTLRSLTNSVLRSSTRKAFEQRFPTFIYLRNAISHSAERTNHLFARKKHGAVKSKTLQVNPLCSINLESEDSSLILHDNIYGNTFSSMWEGKIVRLDLSDETGEFLDQTSTALRKSFEPIFNPEPEPRPNITVSQRSRLKP
jgi:hypothetical protein